MAIEADDFAADDDFFGNDRLVLIIFRLQTDVIFLFVEALDGRIFIANECDYDVAILSVILLGNDEVVAFMDACIDHAVAPNNEHEAVVILADEFREYFRKKGFVPKDTADAKESIQYMDEVMKKIREINRRNRLLKSKYKGDERFVRIHKRIEEQNEKREKPIISKHEYEIAENLANMKQDIDRMIFLDINKLDNEPAFQQDVLAIIGKELLKMHIRADIKDRKFINNLITTEYLQQRNYTY